MNNYIYAIFNSKPVPENTDIMETFLQRAHMQAKALSLVLVKTPLCYWECSFCYLDCLLLMVKDY